jgi:hypothetical protein
MSDRSFALGFVLLVCLAIGGIVAVMVAGARAGREAQEEPEIAASCTEWTDGCVICRRGVEGPSCSTPGIACVRTAPVCLSP